MKMISDLGIRNAEIENRKRPEGGAFFFYRIDAEDGPGGLLRQGCEGQRAGPYRSLNTRIQSEKKSLRSLRLSGKKLRIIGLFFTAEGRSLLR